MSAKQAGTVIAEAARAVLAAVAKMPPEAALAMLALQGAAEPDGLRRRALLATRIALLRRAEAAAAAAKAAADAAAGEAAGAPVAEDVAPPPPEPKKGRGKKAKAAVAEGAAEGFVALDWAEVAPPLGGQMAGADDAGMVGMNQIAARKGPVIAPIKTAKGRKRGAVIALRKTPKPEADSAAVPPQTGTDPAEGEVLPQQDAPAAAPVPGRPGGPRAIDVVASAALFAALEAMESPQSGAGDGGGGADAGGAAEGTDDTATGESGGSPAA